jgi:hypothetical protein
MSLLEKGEAYVFKSDVGWSTKEKSNRSMELVEKLGVVWIQKTAVEDTCKFYSRIYAS